MYIYIYAYIYVRVYIYVYMRRWEEGLKGEYLQILAGLANSTATKESWPN